jgi:hypothetical protein
LNRPFLSPIIVAIDPARERKIMWLGDKVYERLCEIYASLEPAAMERGYDLLGIARWTAVVRKPRDLIFRSPPVCSPDELRKNYVEQCTDLTRFAALLDLEVAAIRSQRGEGSLKVIMNHGAGLKLLKEDIYGARTGRGCSLEQKQKRKAELNRLAAHYLRANPQMSIRELARKLRFSRGWVQKLDAWQTAMKKRPESRRAPDAVTLTSTLTKKLVADQDRDDRTYKLVGRKP